MTIKLIVIVSLAAVVSCNSETPVAFTYVDGYGYAAVKSEGTDKKTPDIAITFAYDTHKTVMEKQYLTPPYHYSWSYEVHNATTNVTQSQYESRYGDVAVGTYILHGSDGKRSIVDYTEDTPNGFYAVLRKDFQGHPAHLGYARLAGPLAYAHHPALEQYASRTTLVADPTVSAEPLSKDAYRTHKLVVNHFELSTPYDMSWSYEVLDAEKGRRSQYETYHGEVGEGSFATVDLDGTTKRKIAYTITPEGISFTSPETFD